MACMMLIEAFTKEETILSYGMKAWLAIQF